MAKLFFILGVLISNQLNFTPKETPEETKEIILNYQSQSGNHSIGKYLKIISC